MNTTTNTTTNTNTTPATTIPAPRPAMKDGSSYLGTHADTMAKLKAMRKFDGLTVEHDADAGTITAYIPRAEGKRLTVFNAIQKDAGGAWLVTHKNGMFTRI